MQGGNDSNGNQIFELHICNLIQKWKNNNIKALHIFSLLTQIHIRIYWDRKPREEILLLYAATDDIVSNHKSTSAGHRRIPMYTRLCGLITIDMVNWLCNLTLDRMTNFPKEILLNLFSFLHMLCLVIWNLILHNQLSIIQLTCHRFTVTKRKKNNSAAKWINKNRVRQ